MSDSKSVTCTAPVNIAVVKYWGKRDEKLILPLNASLGLTMDMNDLCATTTVQASPSFTEDCLWLNDCKEPISKRFKACLEKAKSVARKHLTGDEANAAILDWHVHVCSRNNFPTAAGLASSAAGYACLGYSFAQLYGVQDEVSVIARLGSGSACRSTAGGFVLWTMGEREDGDDSVAVEVSPASAWPDLEVLILVVNDRRKDTSSTAGMQTSVQTSQLLKHRAAVLVPDLLRGMEEAIHNKDFATFADLTMKDSNQFHAVCLDTYPPIFYLNDTSRRIIQMVTKVNAACGEAKVAYTFDAGPNAVLFVRSKDVEQIAALCDYLFVSGKQSDNLDQALVDQLSLTAEANSVRNIIRTKAGPGPRRLPDEKGLLDSNGLPLPV
eukprot:scpid68360/ scgid35179/ Diphosphomevalonate decarboxylase; Mevalonate (diphospho)decarboxylase; Mevalonate pyrophosphate decarboxylase